MKPDPDIAGKGVIVAFTVTAMITLLLAIFCLVVGRTHEGRQSFNPIDRYARKYISEPTRRLMFRVGMNPDLQSLVAYDLVNTFSDLQLVTGLAVLVGGIKELADSRISTCPIKCVVNERKGGDPWVMMIYNMVILSYYYVVQMFLSWRTGRLFWMDHIRKYLIDKKGQPVNVLSPDTVFRRWIENKFQLVPIFLLIIPFMGLFESYARHSKALGELNAKELESCPSEP
ncbi:hypothetical protein LY78DRAFT_575500 [Colletotrichum sublineola]|nr:hypothetical protein LY78DRAFT_575500 [Colletotrichum sublineola]